MTSRVSRLDGTELFSQSAPRLFQRLEGNLAVQFSAVLTREECAEYSRAVFAARSTWTSNFEGIQFTLGRAFYTHLEQGRDDDYFEHAEHSNGQFEKALPGLRDRVQQWTSALLGARVFQRDGWCGPGVHIFPAHSEVSVRGGDVHFDTEGLSEEAAQLEVPAATLVLMLQLPTRGGELRVWDRRFEGDYEDETNVSGEFADVHYETGDIVIIDSYRQHQIQPFYGNLDRISLTAHIAFEDGRWVCWF